MKIGDRIRRSWLELRLLGRVRSGAMRAVDEQLDALNVSAAVRDATRKQMRLRVRRAVGVLAQERLIPPDLPADRIEDYIRKRESEMVSVVQRAAVERIRTRGSQP